MTSDHKFKTRRTFLRQSAAAAIFLGGALPATRGTGKTIPPPFPEQSTHIYLMVHSIQTTKGAGKLSRRTMTSPEE
jgi:hypothetical protein